jgi:hypothetical protein
VTTNVVSGKPDIKSIIQEMAARQENSSGGRIAVMVCGPAALAAQVRDLCNSQRRSRNGGSFDYHAEVFEF